jgi:putative transferase (TIGR04331 family)
VKYLVTTALEETWPNTKDNVLFLGKWCKLYGRKTIWDKFNSITAPYHWDNRRKLEKDFRYIHSIQKILLSDLTNQLNALHKVNYSKSYWHILIGPWLNTFSQLLFDRWSNLTAVFESFDVDVCKVIERDPMSIIPFDMSDFSPLIASDDWNEGVYGQLLIRYFSNKLDIKKQLRRKNKIHAITKKEPISRYTRFKKIFFYFIKKVNAFTLNPNEGFIYFSTMPRIQETKLQILLRQFPKVWSHIECQSMNKAIKPVKREWREWVRKDIDDDFFKVLCEMIPFHIPTLYIEGYQQLISCTKNLPWPEQPRFIFTSSSHYQDEIFKAWAAKKKESGCAFLIGQHGGHYGVASFNSFQDFEISISDYFISWGWGLKEDGVINLGNFKELDSKNIKFDKNGDALLVLNHQQRYTYMLSSVPMSGQWEDYFNDQYDFIKSIPRKIRANIKIRLAPNEYGWGLNKRFIDLDLGVKFDHRDKSVKETIRGCRLYISTTNATTYLESLSWNVPTVIFWNPEYWEINDEAKTYFDLLKSVGIFHETPESAARHVEDVWDNVDVWWDSELVQEARERFCVQYSNTPNNLLKKMSLVLKSIN